MSSQDEVRKASARFYAALNSMANGDSGAMEAAWSTSAEATAQHPIGGIDLGAEAVLGSFAKVASIAQGGQIALAEQRIDAGAEMAVETGIERGTLTLAGHPATIEHRVTNVYRREAGGWKIRHHHTDQSPAMLDILARLREAG